MTVQVDIKLKGFPAANKIKVIKEIRGVTNLGLKEVRPVPSFVSVSTQQRMPRLRRCHALL